MAGVYIFIILIFRVFQSFFRKRTSNEIDNHTLLVGFNAFQSAISAILGLVFVVIEGKGFKFDLLTLFISLFSGLSLFLSSYFSMSALKSGTLGLNAMFLSAGMIIPIFAGTFLFDEPVMFMQIVGLLIFFLSAYLLVGESKTIYTNFSYKTLLLLIGSLITNGCIMLSQEMYTTYVPNGSISMFSFMSFFIISILSGIYYSVLRKGASKENDSKFSKNLIVYGVILAGALFGVSQFATVCTKLVSPVILFSFICGGETIISTIVAAIAYKEKISKKTAIGIFLGIVSLVVIKFFE